MMLEWADVIKLLLAVGVGGLIGAEREFRDKAAGFRTMILICVGSTMFTIVSIRMALGTSAELAAELPGVVPSADPTRIASYIVAGIGFLGGGAIIRDAGRIAGLTTASTIWMTAALGMGIGAGHFALSLIATAAIMIVLLLFRPVENWIGRGRELRIYRVTIPLDEAKLDELEELFAQSGLHVHGSRQVKRSEKMICRWDTYGSSEQHAALSRKLRADRRVQAVEYEV